MPSMFRTGVRKSGTPPLMLFPRTHSRAVSSPVAQSAVSGVVLAAGRSRRMGEPKALLGLDGVTLLARAVRALRDGGCGEVVVVAGPVDESVPRRIAEAVRAEGARPVHNPLPHAEQIDSLRVGLRALAPGARAAVVTPVDLPGIGARTVGALIRAWEARAAPVVVPTLRGTHGHPTLFAREVFGELLHGSLAEGARSVVHAHAHDLEAVPIPDEGVLHDVDTPEQFRRFVGGAG